MAEELLDDTTEALHGERAFTKRHSSVSSYVCRLIIELRNRLPQLI